MARITKKDIYASYDIQFDGEKIYCDLLDMWVMPLLINGNEKIGRGVWHFSTLAGKGIVSDEIVNDVIGKHARLAGHRPTRDTRKQHERGPFCDGRTGNEKRKHCSAIK